MATLLLVRHGRTTANASGLLAGRTPGVLLDELGTEQAARAGARIAAVPVVRLVTSPQERCKQTAKAVADGQRGAGHPVTRATTEKALAECDYGDWQGQAIKTLLKEPLWRTVQQQPSAVTFPGGESMVAMQHRAVAAVRRLDAAITAEHGSDAVWVAVSHGDIIKSVLADALGLHLDLFQRINVDPASISVVRYAADRPYVLATNTHDGDLSWLRKAPPKDEGAVVGGGSGPA
ncbi:MULTISPECIES: MSMEG_4193 family putative phosphomutase [unclassified Nocardioides]|jgi:probable phosphomutase (TIGR03848 family)|uniref:MSMEG_4193 family putative phosphomutase n=1 Tax=unclassified Nocardioides TaxID=2615069 RepID=UPI000702A2BC|nr:MULTISPECIES: MSMEG_4193 family putative phosphomutase [unclassified Nocardioides]KRC50235.1 histidine phosphatase [Nocardioides sp. Root79]KRC75702.1 histidine phosphatase [Nocardioides sp. Root240]